MSNELQNKASNELTVKNFSLAYGDNVLFKNFTYTFKPGIYIFSGESGVGKTTLMRFIAGLEHRCTGEIIVDGEAIKKYSPKIHMVHQHYTSFPWLNLVDNALMVYRGHKKPIGPEDVEEAKNILTKLGLGAHLEKYPTQISGGQDQRLSLANAFINKWSNVILYDEPSSALDEANTLLVAEMILEHQRKFNTVEIVITHQDELEEALNGTILKFEKDFRIRPDLESQKEENNSTKKKEENRLYTKVVKATKTVYKFGFQLLNRMKDSLLLVIQGLAEDDSEMR